MYPIIPYGATRMSTIIGLDLGKFKSVACTYDADTDHAQQTAPPDAREDAEEIAAAVRGPAGREVRPARADAGGCERVACLRPGGIMSEPRK